MRLKFSLARVDTASRSEMAVQRHQHTEAANPRPTTPLHECSDCDSVLVYPVDWTEAGPGRWTVSLRCPNCEAVRSGTFSQDQVDAFDAELDDGAEALARDLTELTRANMADDVERFAAALRADAILPEDF
jgi:hypothetical protein